MSSVTFIHRTFLPVQSVRLGRFVRNRDEPQSEYLDPDSNTPLQPIINPHLSYGEVQQHAAGKNFSAFLTSLVSSSWTKTRKQYTHVTTSRVTTYQLDNAGLWFKEAVKPQTTREWVRESIDLGNDIYMVVGYSTMLDAVVVEGSADLAGTEAQVTMPVTASLAATGAVIPLGNITDPGISGKRDNYLSIRRQYVASGEQVCGVQYRKVCFRWFSSRDVTNAFLHGDCRWKWYSNIGSNIRGQEIGTNDIVEVELKDALEIDYEQEEYESDTYGKFVW